MDKKIDWSKAPDWADKHGFSSYGANPVWLSDDQYCYIDGAQDGRVFVFADHDGWEFSEIHNISFRPIHKAWTGEGLPPVGIECERMWASGPASYTRVRVIAHDEGQAIYRFLGERQKGKVQADAQGPGDSSNNPTFRPIRTPEQIAAEERVKAIDEMAAVYKSNYEGHVKDGCQALYDAGYRKQPADL